MDDEEVDDGWLIQQNDLDLEEDDDEIVKKQVIDNYVYNYQECW